MGVTMGPFHTYFTPVRPSAITFISSALGLHVNCFIYNAIFAVSYIANINFIHQQMTRMGLTSAKDFYAYFLQSITHDPQQYRSRCGQNLLQPEPLLHPPDPPPFEASSHYRFHRGQVDRRLFPQRSIPIRPSVVQITV